MATLPPKLYFRIGEVASHVGVEPHVLRYWEREFRSIRPTKSAKGQRVYSRRDVENLMRVRDLLYAAGFTIAGAKKKLQRSGTEPDGQSAANADATPSDADDEPGRATPSQGADPEEAARAQGHHPNGANGNSDGAHSVQVRSALKELRSEIEALLAELGG
ncbi:MAG: MerR family transcriptional regulator [Polyangiaceae bacterium]